MDQEHTFSIVKHGKRYEDLKEMGVMQFGKLIRRRNWYGPMNLGVSFLNFSSTYPSHQSDSKKKKHDRLHEIREVVSYWSISFVCFVSSPFFL